MTRRIRQATIRAITGRSGRIRLNPASVNEEFRQIFASLGRTFLSYPGHWQQREPALAIAGLVTEGIALVDEAIAFARACSDAVVVGDKVYVAFTGMFDRPRCVQLSNISIRLLQRQFPDSPSIDTHRALENWVLTHTTALPKPVAALCLPPLELLELSAEAHWLEFLPASLFADAITEMSIVPLPISALARLATRAPLQRSVGDADAEEDVQVRAAMLLEMCNTHAQTSVADQVRSILNRPQEGGKGTHRRKQLSDLSMIVDATEDDALGLLFAFFGSGLLTLGTVQKGMPSESIKRRYFAAIEDAMLANPELAGKLHLMDREGRGEQYLKWIQAAKARKDASAALSALDMYLVVHFDVEPARVQSGIWENPGLASPGILWEHEQAGISAAIDSCARTPAIAEVAKCLAELGQHKSFRPSDVMFCILGDAHVYDEDHLVLDVRKHRGFPGQKTEAAAHPLEFRNAKNEIPHLSSFVAECAGRGKGWSEPLWGKTPEEARRTFRDAWALLNQLAKAYTGDPKASIYWYRHTWFSLQLEAALKPHGTALDHRLLARIANEGGHKDVTTSLTWYFHLPMAPVRAHADRALESLLTPTSATAWGSLTRDAIYHRVSRANASGATPIVDSMRDGLQLVGLMDVEAIFSCQPLTEVPLGRAPVKFSDVLSAVAFLDAHRDWWNAPDARGPMNQFEFRVASERKMLLAQYTSPVTEANLAQEKLGPLRKYLRDHGTGRSVRAACDEWARGEFEGYVDVERHESLLVWLDLLKASGTHVSRIVVRMVEPSDSEVVAMSDRVAAATGMTPRIERVPGGYSSRPKAYLLLSSKDVTFGKSAASGDVNMNGFNGLMTAARIRLRLLEPTNASTGEEHGDA